jgi:ASC-1-like (ASCH) protein
MEKLSNMVDNAEYAKIVRHHFSDNVLEVMANNRRELSDRLAHTKLTNEGVERLVKAYDSNIITMGDLLHIMNYSLVSSGNEKYFNDYFSSIAAGLDTQTASRILVAAKFEDWSYNEIYSMVKSGAYQVGDNTFVALNPDVAREIDKLGIELYAYDKTNDFYLVKDIEKTIADGDSITFSRSALAVKINEMRGNSDWEDFRNYIAEDIEDIEHLTIDGLVEAYQEYRVEELNIELSRKVDRNFEAFIQGIREQGVDEAIKCSYEITVKTNIQSYIESEPADISEEQYSALISSDNPLDDVYGAWLKCEYLKTYDDIPKAMEYAADGILESKIRTQVKESEMLTDKPQLPKRKGVAR